EARLVGVIVSGAREAIGLQCALVVEIRQAVEEADKRFLYHVFAGGPIAQPALGKGQEPPFIAGDQLVPSSAVALANLLDEQAIAVGSHAHQATQPGRGWARAGSNAEASDAGGRNTRQYHRQNAQ